MDSFPSDLIISFGLYLNSTDLNSYFILSKRFRNLRNNEIFWMNKSFHDFGQIQKEKNRSWKQFYQKLITTEPNNLLWEGVKNNQLSLVKAALARGAFVDVIKTIYYSNYSPLSWASCKGYLEIVKYLVEHGANIHHNDDHPVRFASLNGQLKVVKYLINKNANIHTQTNDALISASMNGYLDVVKYLVSEGANINDEAIKEASYSEYLEVVEYLVSMQN